MLYRFTGGSDGRYPTGDLTLDPSGNVYGTTVSGGNAGNGVIYEVTPSAGIWIEKVLYSLQDRHSGTSPEGGVTFDNSGNLYGVFSFGGPNGDSGAVYELSPSGLDWTEQTLYGFTGENDGGNPSGGLIWDESGNLYGTTVYGGSGGGGTVFELTSTNGGWEFNLLYGLSGGVGPLEKLVLDAGGNLYGTTQSDGAYGMGSVFKLTPSGSGWTYTSLHDFTGSEGEGPACIVVFDANGNLYGTASYGGLDACRGGCGVVWEITP